MTTHRGSQESIERISKAARTLFAKKGYASASLEEIAGTAGFTKGAVYHFFRSKEALLLSLLRDIEQRSIAHAMAVLDGLGAVSAREKLLRFITVQAQWGFRNPDDLAVLVKTSMESAERQSAVREQVRRMYARIEEAQLRLLREGVANGEFPADLPVEDVVTWMMAIYDGNMLIWYRSGRDKEVGRRLTLASQHLITVALRAP